MIKGLKYASIQCPHCASDTEVQRVRPYLAAAQAPCSSDYDFSCHSRGLIKWQPWSIQVTQLYPEKHSSLDPKAQKTLPDHIQGVCSLTPTLGRILVRAFTCSLWRMTNGPSPGSPAHCWPSAQVSPIGLCAPLRSSCSSLSPVFHALLERGGTKESKGHNREKLTLG